MADENNEDGPADDGEGAKDDDEELRKLAEEAALDGADAPRGDAAAVASEIRAALDAEDGIPSADEVERADDEVTPTPDVVSPPADDVVASAGGTPEADAASHEAVEHMRTLTGFRRAYLPIMLVLPFLTYYMFICITYYGGRLFAPTSWAELGAFLAHLPLPTWQALLIFAGWMGLQAGLQAWAPGPIVYGTPLPDGQRLPYKMNGQFSFWTTMGLAVLLVVTGVLPATLLADQFGPLLTLGHIFAFAFSVFLYVHGKKHSAGERLTGNVLYDYFMGTTRNPRIGDFDLKLFFEARPGLILWVLINFSFAARQYALHGHLTTPMILVCLFHFMYVADYYGHEKAILSTMDIKHENFGWMLCWGDYPWVPFTYTLQAMYLVNHTHELPWYATVGIVALMLGGYVLFRAVNSQKDRFRDDPDAPIWGKKPEYIRTKRGTLLLTSGYWGIARHLNYCGDIMLGLSWCLPCGFGHLLPYFYAIYFTWLLIHRQWRDDKMCEAKYGADWDEYCKKVRWKIVPYVY
jgi:protein-S-isoprenylcysteine O-methyltransferase Ste14